MVESDLKIFKLTIEGNFEMVDSISLNLFTLVDILAIYVVPQKRLYLWIGENVTQSLRIFIPEIRNLFSEKLPDLYILRNITIESGSEPHDFFEFIGFTEEQLKSRIRSQEIELLPTIKEIKSLKKKLEDLIYIEEYEDAIKISDQIIGLSKITKDKALEKEQLSQIKNLREKAKIKTDIELIVKEVLEIKNQYENLIDSNKSENYIKAHQMVEELSNKYKNIFDLTSLPSAELLFVRDENIWYNFNLDQKDFVRELKLLKNQMETVLEEKEVGRATKIWEQAEDLLNKVLDREIKIEWDEIEKKFIELKEEFEFIEEIENIIEESTNLMEKFQFEEALSKIESTIELTQEKNIIGYDERLNNKKVEIIAAQVKYAKIREKIVILEENIKKNKENKNFNAAITNCENIINLYESIKKTELVEKYIQILKEIEAELEDEKSITSKELASLIIKGRELEEYIEVDENVLPLIEEFSINELLGDLSDNINENLEKIGKLLNEHRVEVKTKIKNKTILTSTTGEIYESEKAIDVLETKEEGGKVMHNVQSGLVNPFEDNIEEGILVDQIPYNYEITNIQFNGNSVQELPNKKLTRDGIEIEWQIRNVPPKEKIEVDYRLHRRISRTIIFVLEDQLKIIKTHSNLNKLKIEGLFEAKLPFTNSSGSALNSVIVEDIFPLYYLYFIKEPTDILPAETSSSNLGELIKWNVGSMEVGTLNYHYKFLELYRLEEIKIKIRNLSKSGIDALNKGDLTESLDFYDKIINQLEKYK